MYLKRFVAFSDEFYEKGGTTGRVQDQLVQIQLQPIFNVIHFSKDISNAEFFDTYEKAGYHERVVLFSNLENMVEAEKVKNEIDSLTQKISIEPGQPKYFYERAEYYSMLQNYNLAIEDYNKAIELDKNYILAYFGKAGLEFRLAILIQREPGYNYEFNTGSLRPQSDDLFDTTLLGKPHENTLKNYDQAISLDPDFYFAWYNRGYVKCLQGDYWGAVSDFTKVIELKPDFSEAFYNKGLILIFLNLKTVGCSDLSRAGELGIQNAYHVMKRYCHK
jgi:tetratricopeptide (TPR) repeat protein